MKTMLQQVKMTKKKRGVSEMIGYILMISFAVVISSIVYLWLRSYVPQQQLECPSDVSIMVKNYSCDLNSHLLTINLKNNGKFSVGGVFVNIKNDPNLKIATIDISDYISSGSAVPIGLGVIRFRQLADLEPNDETSLVFDLTSANLGTIYSVDISPIRWQEENNKPQQVICGDSKITEQLTDCFLSEGGPTCSGINTFTGCSGRTSSTCVDSMPFSLYCKLNVQNTCVNKNCNEIPAEQCASVGCSVPNA